ncbi:MAG: hypothetical protein RL571_1678 [Pseudomonadota bacterium]|jgi:uncharacterized protein (UPF0276 family)
MPLKISGLGVNASPGITSDFITDIIDSDFSIDFIEINPEEFDLDCPKSMGLINRLMNECPLVLHTTTLSLAGSNNLSNKYLNDIRMFGDKAKSLYYSDHLSFIDSGDIRLDLYTPPIFTNELMHIVCDRINKVKNTTKLPFVFENVGLLFPPLKTDYSEVDFIKNVLYTTDSKLMLNLDSVAISASTLKLDPLKYLSTFPLDKLQSITFVPRSCMNPIMAEIFGVGIDSLMLEMTEYILQKSDVNMITLQRRQGNTMASVKKEFLEIKQIFNQYRPH